MATTNIGPDRKLSQFVDTFVHEVDDDFRSPGVSRFQDQMPFCRKGVQSMEEGLSMDKSNVHKLIGSLKELVKCGEAHGHSLGSVADDLVKFGTAMMATEPMLGNNFAKFGTLLKQMSSLLSNLASSTKNILVFSLNLLFENELKGSSYKSNIKALSGQYQSSRNSVEKDEKRILVQAGVSVAEKTFTAEELAAKLVSDRRRYQLGVCEYMLKFNEVRTKRGVELADHLVGYYQAQEGYFKDGSMLLQALKSWEDRFTSDIQKVRAEQDEERKRLNTLRDSLRKDMGIITKEVMGPSNIDPATCSGMLEKSGYLGKRPENFTAIFTRAWPKRYCTVTMQGFSLAHSHTHAPIVRIPAIHFQFKECPEPIDGKKFCFKLIAQTRTYTFDAESEKELIEWRTTMTNCQTKLFEGGGGDGSTFQRQRSLYSPSRSSTNVRELVKRIITKIRSLPGNDRCCDCDTPDPEWLSVNLGILICINCSGRHRELSVQYSRIRSLKLDQMKTPELLIALVMGNGLLNEVLEANRTDPKPNPDATTVERQEYISKKYLQRKYIEASIGKDHLLQELAESVDSRDIKQLLQVYAEGADLCAPLPSYHGGMTALHLAIELEDLTSLHIVDFILGNGRTENCPDDEGNTPLHLAVAGDNPQCVKLLLNHGSNVSAKNNAGKVPLDIAEEKNFDECIELLQDAAKSKFAKCDHIDIDWGVSGEQEEDIYQTPILDSQPAPATSEQPLPPGSSNGTAIKHSASSGDIVDVPPPPSKPHKIIDSILEPLRRRPASVVVDPRRHPHITRSEFHPPLIPSRDPFRSQLPNAYPAPSHPPPPPPMRLISKNADPLPSISSPGRPVAPKRNKKRTSMFPDQFDPTSPPPSVPAQPLLLVTALYDCNPDHRDELGFAEGDIIVVVKKLNKDWWRGYVNDKPERLGVFPVNHVVDRSQEPAP